MLTLIFSIFLIFLVDCGMLAGILVVLSIFVMLLWLWCVAIAPELLIAALFVITDLPEPRRLRELVTEMALPEACVKHFVRTLLFRMPAGADGAEYLQRSRIAASLHFHIVIRVLPRFRLTVLHKDIP